MTTPDPTAGPGGDPPAPDPAVVPPHGYGWGISLTGTTAHYVPFGLPCYIRDGREIGFGLDRFPAIVDAEGLAAAQLVDRCLDCQRRLAARICICRGTGIAEHSETLSPGVTNISRAPCPLCKGARQLPEQPREAM